MSTSQRRGSHKSSADRRVTITDVAHAAGVSIAVVSYALNNRPGVSDRTRRHVLKIASDLGWRPNAAARSMRSADAFSIGLQSILDAGNHSRAAVLELAHGLRAALSGAPLSIEVAQDRRSGATDLETGWTERRHTAFVAQDLLRDDPRARLAQRIGAPLVAVTPAGIGTAGTPRSVWFTGDAEAAVGRYLVDLGHRRIALLVRDADVDVARALKAGLHDAVAGLVADVQVVEYASPADAAAGAARLLSPAQRPTAVVTDGDLTALAVLEAARHRELTVPWDLSVVSGADAETCRLVDPQLTAVARPWRDLGPALAALVRPQPVRADTTAGRDGQPGEAPLPPSARLVIRGTTAPPAAP